MNYYHHHYQPSFNSTLNSTYYQPPEHPATITITVRPSKSAYFAGERFECTIEINRVNQPTTNNNHSARLSATSISPSPSTPAESDCTYQSRNSLLPKRQGLIGSSIQHQQPTTTTSTTYHHQKAESIGSTFPNPSFSFSIQEPPSPNLPASPKTGGPVQGDGIPPTEYEKERSYLNQLSSRKTSTPISGTVYKPAILDQHAFNPRRASLHAIGASAPAHRTGFSRTTPLTRTEIPSTALLGWTYCQLEGSFEVSPKHFNLDQFNSLHHPQTRGGGTLLDDHQSLTQSRRNSSSWMGWLFGASSTPNHNPHPPSSTSPNRFPVFQNPISLLDVDIRLEPGQSRSYSFAIDLPIDLPPTHRGKLIKFNYELIVGTNLLSADVTTPTTPPTSNLGHGYRAGRSSTPILSADPFRTRFSTPSALNFRPQDPKSQTFRVPIRVFNHVYLNETRPYYDLFKPIISTRDTAQTRRMLVTPATMTTKSSSKTEAQSGKSPKAKKSNHSLASVDGRHGLLGGLAGLESYALELLKCASTGYKEDPDSPRLTPDGNPPPTVLDQGEEWGEELDEGCITAVEIATRSAPKVSFDINKDGRLVAHLTLVKSTYRLGETIEGTIEMNGSTKDREGGRVMRWGASLETIESVNPSSSIEMLENSGKKKSVRKVYSESEELVIDSSRARFSLFIPFDPAPQFDTSLVSLIWTIKLRFQFVPFNSLAPNHPSPVAHPLGSHLIPLSTTHGTFIPLSQLGFLASRPLSIPLHHPLPPSPSSSSPSSPSVAVSVTSSPTWDHFPSSPSKSLHSLSSLRSPSSPSSSFNPSLLRNDILHKSNPCNLQPQKVDLLHDYHLDKKPLEVELFQCDLPIKIISSNTKFLPSVHHFSL